MSAYDFTAASDFLQYEAGITPDDLYYEIVDALDTIAALENKRNRKAANSIWDTLRICADFVDRITPKEVKQAI